MKRRRIGCFEFIFEDNGIGMSQEIQDIIFEPFSRADDKRTTKIQGTGLGLAITKNIVTMMEGKRVLIVEDNTLNMEIAVELASMTGVTIETAENGKIAVEMVANAPEKYYDLILMDIQMPALDGYEATAQIRALDKDYIHSLPIVAMTANAFDVEQLVTVMEKLL